MFGFPLPLYDSGNSGVKLTNNADSGFPKPNIGETFYSIKDGSWLNTNTWQTASGRVGLLPTINDDVYVRHTVGILWETTNNITINNITVTEVGKLTGGPSSGFNFNVVGDFKYYGVYDSTATLSGLWAFYGLNNYIDISKQTQKISVNYVRNGDQPIMNANYSTINLNNSSGLKYTISDLIVDAVTYAGGSGAALYVKNPYSFTCNGAFNCNYFYSDTENNLTFKGTTASLYMFFCTNNPTIEFQNSVTLNQGNYAATGFILPFPYGNQQSMYLGTGLVKFTTNNISINNTGTIFYDNDFLIDNNIVVTTTVANANTVLLKTINGSNAASQLINKGFISFYSVASLSSLTTGIWDFTTFANTIAFNGNYSGTIPSYFTTFNNLQISGTGTKTLGVNTTVNGNLLLQGVVSTSTSGILQCSTYNLTVNGTTTTSSGSLLKSGAGSILFIGVLTTGSGYNYNTINFSGNPSVELRGGISGGTYGWANLAGGLFSTGTGTWTFTTNNQNVSLPIASYPHTFDCPILISGAITITWTSYTNLNNTINGNNAASKLLLGVSTTFNFATSASVPSMTTGTWDFTTNANTIQYSGNYSATIPSYFTTFSSLTIGGTGTKTLGVNTTLNGNLIVGTSSTLELSTYNLTVTGTTQLTASTLSKSGAGSILFVGLVTLNYNASNAYLTFNGNPNIEFRNGLFFSTGTYVVSSGTGQWSFTTNSQPFTNSSYSTLTFDCSILISGAITLTFANGGGNPGTNTFNGVINGDNANSKLLMNTIGGPTTALSYRSATQPMATGILDTSTNLNTWIYGLGNQAIKGGASLVAKQVYRNLTLSGSGTTKTLQGYVSVLNTYSLGTGVTLNNNGFTLTNP